MNREYGMLFKPEMIRAIIPGLKDMTRRLKGLKFINNQPRSWDIVSNKCFDKQFVFYNQEEGIYYKVKPPHGNVGDLIYIKETWSYLDLIHEYPGYIYRVDDNLNVWEREHRDYIKIKWKSPLFMPKNAARLWLQIIAVKLEKVQNITDADAIREGVNSRDEFEKLWKKINGLKSWNDNWWVWVYTFKIVDKCLDSQT